LTLSRPLRRLIWLLSQILLTLGLTFIVFPSFGPCPAEGKTRMIEDPYCSGKRFVRARDRRETAPQRPGLREECGCNADASFRRYAPAPCAHCSAPPETMRSAEPRQRALRSQCPLLFWPYRSLPSSSHDTFAFDVIVYHPLNVGDPSDCSPRHHMKRSGWQKPPTSEKG